MKKKAYNSCYPFLMGGSKPLKTILSLLSLSLIVITTNAQNNSSYNANAIPINGNSNSAFGVNSLFNNSGGANNAAVGYRSLYSNISGSGNASVGFESLYSNSSGGSNAAFGASALRGNTIGVGNTGSGYYSLYTNGAGNYNTATGAYALKVNTASQNTANGAWALYANTNGTDNTAAGYKSLYNNTSGKENIAIGSNALRDNLIGNHNISLGVNAGLQCLGSDNIFIGYGAGANETANNKLYIGTSTSTLIYGNFATGQVLIGDNPSSVTMPNGYKLFVRSGILAEKIKVALASSAYWSDYVFAPSYKLKPLSEVEAYVKANKHLEGIPSANDLVEQGGIDVNAMFAKQMEKIEELTLYLIEIRKEIEVLKTENNALKAANIFNHNKK